jgi:hypothetical protein
MTPAQFREWEATVFPPMPGVNAPVTYIYGLTEPGTCEIRYIGKSIRPLERLQNHINEPPSNCHRSHWIQGLKAMGLRPELTIIEAVRGSWPWQESERHWIAYGKANGWRLTNNTDGGDGVEGLPKEARERMVRTWRGRKHRPETIEKLRAARSMRPLHTAETKAKMSASQRGRKILWIDKVAAALRKLTRDDEADIRARLAAGERVTDLAKEYGVHRTTMSKVKMGTYR